MALSDDRIDELSREMVKGRKSVNWLASKIEAEVRKDDEALIRQLMEALENSNATLWEEDDDPERPAHAAIAAARARLEQPCA